MKKKNLPDHRIKFSSNLIEFEDDFVANLVADYGFLDEYPLAEKLDRFAWFNEKPEYFKNTPNAEQKVLWKEVEDSSFNLRSAIANLGPEELLTLGRVNVLRNSQGQIVESFNRYDWIVRLEVISDVARMANKLVSKASKRGRPAEERKSSLVMCLVKIYREGTRKDDRYWQLDDDGHSYTGPLIKFCERIIKLLGFNYQVQQLTKSWF